MNGTLGFTAADRVLVFAPHPDDESLATGGLLQAALAAGAAVRVVIVTDGDNNPWPQRWLEKRWRIDAAARANWGVRRRCEAQRALHVLGIAPADAQFLGLPDLGLTSLLMRADNGLIARLRQCCDDFIPTCLVLPALSDRHPDHNALHVMLRVALAQSSRLPRFLSFSIHGEVSDSAVVNLPLTLAQVDRKRAAIRAHASQMCFSARRFLAYAKNVEKFGDCTALPVVDPGHPLQCLSDKDNNLHIGIDLNRWRSSLRGQVLMLALECSKRGSLRWQLALDGSSRVVDVFDCVNNCIITRAACKRSPTQVEIAIAFTNTAMLRQGYAKLGRPKPGLFVFDRFGWQVISLA